MAVSIQIKRANTESDLLNGTLSVGELGLVTSTCTVWSFNGLSKCLVGRATIDTYDNIVTYSGTAGRFFFASDTESLYVHNGVAWKEISSSNTSTSGAYLNARGQGVFSTDGTSIVHNLGTVDHTSIVTPAGTASYDPELISAIGNTYVRLGANSDVVYMTGGPSASGIPFSWEAHAAIALDEPAGGGISLAQLTTTSGDIIAQLPQTSNFATQTNLTTTSGDIVSQIPSLTNYASKTNLTTTSGDIISYVNSHTSPNVFSTTVTLDGQGSVIATGMKDSWYVCPASGIITGWYMFADRSGSLTFDVLKADYNNYPSTLSGSICGSNYPTISGGLKSKSNTLAGWTVSFSEGDTLKYYVRDVSTIQRVTLTLLMRTV